ncbi:hypothetical protein [Salinicola peritrichatus]|uniref:hypothetical protein n=1 Tax=Salinicola peritrichatus TaxID=1267424 RepID=UPI000DA2461D|nr:hypothetical protein [Salinicola peritrichatus]
MSISRRDFLLGLGSCTLLLALPAWSLPAAARAQPQGAGKADATPAAGVRLTSEANVIVLR